MTRQIGFVLLLVFSLFLSSSVYANTEGKDNCCPAGKHEHGKRADKGDFLIEKRAELGLTDEQVKTIEEIKAQIQKDREKLQSVLTPDQLAKLKEMKKDWKKDHRSDSSKNES